MPEVFLSYRQTDEDQKQRVRAFGERLRGCGIKLILINSCWMMMPMVQAKAWTVE